MKSRAKYYLKYTAVFFLFILAVYGYYLLYDKSFVNREKAYGDGLVQHYNALCYYAGWLRKIIRTLLNEHRLVIPEWSFSIGYGSDILASLHYYVIGDPFCLPSVLVPVRYMEYYYGLMIIARMYCAGIACSEFCFYIAKKQQMDNSILAGALAYTFCSYAVCGGIRHPFFINPMIYCPMLLLGAEKILRKEKPLLFILSVCVSAVSNFYFFYMLVIVTVGFVTVRLGTRYRRSLSPHRLKDLICDFLRIGIFSVLGLGCGAAVFLPVILSVFRDTRFAAGTYYDLLYPLSYYANLPSNALTYKNAEYWSLLGLSPAGFLSLFLLFAKRKKYGILKSLFLGMTLILLIPAAGSVMNAFSYPANRWIWACMLFISYLIVVMWPDLLHMNEKEKLCTGLGLLGYFLLCLLLDNSRTENFAYCLLCAAGLFAALQIDFSSVKKTVCRRERLILFFAFVSVSINGYYHFSVKESSLLEEYADRGKVFETAFETQDIAVAEAAAGESDFFRYTHFAANNNSTLHSGLHSLQYFWSLTNPDIVASNQTLGILGRTQNNYFDQNNRAGLTDLANVRYFADLAGRTGYAPYGYEFVGSYSVGSSEDKKWDVYRNSIFLPFGYTYSSVLDRDEFESFSSTQKEKAMLQGALLEPAKDSPADAEAALPTAEPQFREQELPYEIVCEDKNISCGENSFIATAKKAEASLSFEGLPDCETYLVIEGLDYKACSPIDLYKDEYSAFDPLDRFTENKWNEKGTMEKISELYKKRNWSQPDSLEILVSGIDENGSAVTQQLYHFTPDYIWYSGKEDYTVNLGYSENARTSVRLVFPEAGIYSFKALKVICRPMDGFEENIHALGRETMEDVVFGTDCVTGKITVSTDKVLCATIPYWKGWTAYVDGEKTEIRKVNMMYSGLILSKGSHSIKFVYRTPGLRTGVLISLISLLTVFGFYIIRYRRRTVLPHEK